MWTTVAPVAAEVMGLQTLPSGEHHGSVFFHMRSLSYFISLIDLLDRTRITYNICRTDCGILENGRYGVQLFVGFMYLAAFISSNVICFP
jgi:hypothetical protein